MAIENIVNANAEILGLLLPQYQMVNADAETGTLSFNINDKLVMINTCNKSSIALELTKHVLTKNNVANSGINKEVYQANMEALMDFRKDTNGLCADVLDCVIESKLGERVFEEDVAVATVE